jgi:hypothetical protein
MRAAILAAVALGAVALILGASAASAAPNCVNVQGEMARCGAPGAMPVGWSPPAAVAAARPTGEADASDTGKLLGLTAFLAGLFGLIALMPDFEGKWDRQAGDDEGRG